MAVTWKKLAFYDEVAIVSDEVSHDVGTTAAAGVATDASRHDHVHRLGNGSVDVAAVLASNVVETAKINADAVDGTKIADDAVGSEHIEALSAALDFAGNQATDLVLHNSADVPATAVLGKIYFDITGGDLHPYVCTSAT